MAEEIKETVEQEQVDTQEQTVSVEEMKRRIAKEQEKAQKQIEELNQSIEAQIQTAVEEYEAKSKMTAKELEELRQKENQRKLEEKDARIAELELENTRRQLRDGAIEVLSERKIPVNDKVLRLVVKDTGEDTDSAIQDLAEIIKEIKNEMVSSTAPLTGDGAKPNIIANNTYSVIEELKKQL